MSALYPLLMNPAFDPRPWGRLDLTPVYTRRFQEKIGESRLTADTCTVLNGALAGQTLAALASRFERDLVGTAPRESDKFPLLVKFLFPHEKLSVQVHPDDEAARAIGQPWGKTECWYVTHAEPGAQVGLGLRPRVARSDFERAIHEQRAEELLNWIPISAGDMIYVAGGTVHTLGPGSIIVETQQQSDTTFRLYDYGRPRELHLEMGLKVIKERPRSGRIRPAAPSAIGRNGNRAQVLVESPFFVVDRLEIHAPQSFSSSRESARILVAIEGSATLEAPGCERINFQTGDAVVVPAAISEFSLEPHGKFVLVQSRVAGATVAEPEIFLD